MGGCVAIICVSEWEEFTYIQRWKFDRSEDTRLTIGHDLLIDWLPGKLLHFLACLWTFIRSETSCDTSAICYIIFFLLQQHPDIKRPEIMLVVVEAVLILCVQLNFNLIQLRLIKKPNHIPTTSYPCRSPMWNSRFSRVFLFLSSSDIRFNHCIEELSAFFPLAIHKYFMNAR